MNGAHKERDAAHVETRAHPDGTHMLRVVPAAQPTEAPGGSVRRPGTPRYRFPVGNKLGGKRKPVDPIEQVDRACRDAITRVTRRQYDLIVDDAGQQVRVERALDAARGNCIANLLRLRLDIISQRAAVEELRRVEDEVEHLKGIVASLLEERQATWR